MCAVYALAGGVVVPKTGGLRTTQRRRRGLLLPGIAESLLGGLRSSRQVAPLPWPATDICGWARDSVSRGQEREGVRPYP